MQRYPLGKTLSVYMLLWGLSKSYLYIYETHWTASNRGQEEPRRLAALLPTLLSFSPRSVASSRWLRVRLPQLQGAHGCSSPSGSLRVLGSLNPTSFVRNASSEADHPFASPLLDLTWVPPRDLVVVSNSRGEFGRDEKRRRRPTTDLLDAFSLFPALVSISVLPVRQRWLRNYR